MSDKLKNIPFIPNYKWIKDMMNDDLINRKQNISRPTIFGKPLYNHINVQLIVTQECPFECPFCLERQHPMTGVCMKSEQLKSLEKILKEHPDARLTITGGEPSLYVDHVRDIVNLYKEMSDNTFICLNTTGYDSKVTEIEGLHINLSVNDYVKPDLKLFPSSTYQTVLINNEMNIANIKRIMTTINKEYGISKFSFRFLTELNNLSYPVNIWNEIQEDSEIEINSFKVGDFFVYTTFDFGELHARVTLGDMNQQMNNDYGEYYSNIIIHPDGHIGVNWK